jgi:hypothetical protein
MIYSIVQYKTKLTIILTVQKPAHTVYLQFLNQLPTTVQNPVLNQRFMLLDCKHLQF